METPKFLKSIFSIETVVGAVIIGAAIWSAMTIDVADVAKAAFTAEKKAAVVETNVEKNSANIEQVQDRVAEIETKLGEQKPTVIVRQVNEAPFRNDAALLERARRLRNAQQNADKNS